MVAHHPALGSLLAGRIDLLLRARPKKPGVRRQVSASDEVRIGGFGGRSPFEFAIAVTLDACGVLAGQSLIHVVTGQRRGSADRWPRCGAAELGMITESCQCPGAGLSKDEDFLGLGLGQRFGLLRQRVGIVGSVLVPQ
jgi:hypothetical protein